MGDIIKLLNDYKGGKISYEQLLKELNNILYKDLYFAKIDVSRRIRKGFPEVIFAEGKTPSQIKEIVKEFLKYEKNILITRASNEIYHSIRDLGNVKYYKEARIITIGDRVKKKRGLVAVITGGTNDIRVAEEAAITAEFFGVNVVRFYDVGVAGLHRLLDKLSEIRKADVIIVCAGMDGALFSVVAGLVEAPVIAVPTSIGYGTNFNGLAPLLTALNSCAPGLVTVNIDNGFGAGYFAALLIKKIYEKK